MPSDLYTKITDRIVASLEAGVRPWLKPWNGDHTMGRISRPLRWNSEPYSGINVVSLWMEAEAKGYSAPVWMTFKQALDLGGCVRKGERGSLTVYADRIRRKDTDSATSEETERQIPFLKAYTAFNVAQIDGLPAHYYATGAPVLDPVQRIAAAETFFAATGAVIRHGGDRAYYSVATDAIQLPPFEMFRDAESYYATLAHETTHWTRHESRLAREFGRKRFGDEGYAMEELVAELGAAFLSADIGLTPEPRDDHAAYIASWLKVLKDDRRAVFTAAAHAQRAADYLHSLQHAAAIAAEASKKCAAR